MRDVNKVVLQGAVADPPETRELEGRQVVTFTVNTDTLQRNPDGSSRPQRAWHHVVVRDRAAAAAVEGLAPGALVYVEGELRTRTYVNRAGHRIWETEVIGQVVQRLDRTDREHVNRAIILGNVGRVDPLKSFAWGQVLNLSVPTSSGWSPHDAGASEVTEWNRVSAFDHIAKQVDETVAKGQRVLVEGLVRSRTYTDRNGVKRRSTEIVAESVVTSSPRAEPAASPSYAGDKGHRYEPGPGSGRAPDETRDEAPF